MLLFHSDNDTLLLLVFWSTLIISVYAFDISIFVANVGLYCGGTRPRKFPTAQSVLSLKRYADKPNVPSISLRFFRRIFGRTQRGNRRGLLTNAHDIDGQQRKESAWLLNKRDSVCPQLRSAKDYAKQT